MSIEKVKKKVTKKMVRITMEVKKEIVEKYEDGMRVRDLAAAYRMPRTTVSSIVKNKTVIKSSNVAKGVKSITKQRSDTLELVEKLLLIWITEMQCARENVSETMICEKAKLMHAELLKSKSETEVFKASHGWFINFRRRTGILGVVRPTGRLTADKDPDFVTQFVTFVKTEGFVPQQVFNCDETSLFWKKMPKNTYLTKEEKALPGHKPMKDKLTLLLCSNASGDCKIKPLLVYHSENPRTFKKHKVNKTQLPVMWRSNSKTWLTRECFIQWFCAVFGPSVKSYLEEKNLPVKAVLVMDKAPGHPPSLEGYVPPEFNFITFKFLPPDITPLIQPMNQQIISNFKKLYVKALFQKCFEMTFDKALTLREFWKEHFNIRHCITLIDKAWQEISCRTINSAWKHLWPEAAIEKDVCDLKIASIVEDIVSLAGFMGLDVSDRDVEELIEEHREELTTDDLQELEEENSKSKLTKPSVSSKKEEKVDTEEPPISLVEDILAKWMDVKKFAEKYHPNKEQTSLNSVVWNNQTMSHFRNILKRRQRENSFVKVEPGSSGEKRRKMEKETTPEYIIPEILLEEDFPSSSFLFNKDHGT